jgi:hypothetical protein
MLEILEKKRTTKIPKYLITFVHLIRRTEREREKGQKTEDLESRCSILTKILVKRTALLSKEWNVD